MAHWYNLSLANFPSLIAEARRNLVFSLMSIQQIAYELDVSEATIKAHVSAILQKLGVESRTQAVIAASKIEAGQWPKALN